MTPDRFRECLDVMHWSTRDFAALIDRDDRRVRTWLSRAAIPSNIANWLEGVVQYVETHPPPQPEGPVQLSPTGSAIPRGDQR